MRSFSFIAVAAISALTLCALCTLPTSALETQAQPETPLQGQALEIAPPVITRTVDPGDREVAQVSVRNISAGSLVVSASVNDFEAGNDEDGSPRVLGLDENDSEPSPYSIVDWVEPIDTLELPSRELQRLPVTINIPDDAAPGGYFGVVRFTATPPELEDSGVSLSASLGALIFLRVSGDANEQLEIADFSVSKANKPGWFFDGAPLQFSQRLRNSGTVYEQPVGRIGVTDMFGNRIANVNINLQGRYILPGSDRVFTGDLDDSVLGDRFLFGLYTANLTTAYGENGDLTVGKTIRFFVLPWQLILVVILLILAIVFGFRAWLKARDAKMMSRSRRRRR